MKLNEAKFIYSYSYVWASSFFFKQRQWKEMTSDIWTRLMLMMHTCILD